MTKDRFHSWLSFHEMESLQHNGRLRKRTGVCPNEFNHSSLSGPFSLLSPACSSPGTGQSQGKAHRACTPSEWFCVYLTRNASQTSTWLGVVGKAKKLVWGKRKLGQEWKIVAGEPPFCLPSFSVFLWQLGETLAGHLLLINVSCAPRRGQEKNRRFIPTFRPDPPPLSTMASKNQYHLAVSDKAGLCASYFVWFSAPAGWDPSYLSVIPMLKPWIPWYSIISLVHLLKLKRKKERKKSNFPFQIKSKRKLNL